MHKDKKLKLRSALLERGTSYAYYDLVDSRKGERYQTLYITIREIDIAGKVLITNQGLFSEGGSYFGHIIVRFLSLYADCEIENMPRA